MPLSTDTIGVLVMAYGTPDGPDDIPAVARRLHPATVESTGDQARRTYRMHYVKQPALARVGKGT